MRLVKGEHGGRFRRSGSEGEIGWRGAEREEGGREELDGWKKMKGGSGWIVQEGVWECGGFGGVCVEKGCEGEKQSNDVGDGG